MRDRDDDRQRAFTRFVKETEPKLSYALAAAYGIDVGAEATADALAWAWEHWDEVTGMHNPAGYLYRVGQSSARRYLRPRLLFAGVSPIEAPSVDPDLPRALGHLTERQRVTVVMIHGLGYTEREVADLLGMSRWSVRTHADRGLSKLRNELGVGVDA